MHHFQLLKMNILLILISKFFYEPTLGFMNSPCELKGETIQYYYNPSLFERKGFSMITTPKKTP